VYQLVVDARPQARGHLIFVFGGIATGPFGFAISGAPVVAHLVAIIAILSAFSDTVATAIWSRRLETTRVGVAGFLSAGIAIVRTNLRLARHTFAAPTLIIFGAYVGIVTSEVIARVNAPLARVAVVVRTEIGIITGEQPGGEALPSFAVVTSCAFTTIRATGSVGRMDATRIGYAGVIGAEIQVVTAQYFIGETLPLLTDFVDRADIGIVTRCIVEIVDAAALRIARIRGADVIVVTDKHGTGHTQSVTTRLIQCTCIPIVAFATSRQMLTPHFG